MRIRPALTLVAGAALITTLAAGAATAPRDARAERPGLSGSVSVDGHTLSWAAGGVSPASTALAGQYDGVVSPGGTVTWSGSAAFTIGAGYVTNLSQYGRLSGGTATQEATFAQRVGGGTYTLPFNLSTKVPTPAAESTARPGDVIGSLSASTASSNCNDYNVCAGPAVRLTFAIVATGGGTPDPDDPEVTPEDDTEPPVVEIAPYSRIVGIGDRIPIRFRVTDDSGQARWSAMLYSGGRPVARGSSRGYRPARGALIKRVWGRSDDGIGPFYSCIQAEDKAGNRSDVVCAWVSVQVKASAVSNGCGTPSYGEYFEWFQNYFGNDRYYGFGPDRYQVQVKTACDVHDAGYAGATVYDPFTKRAIDFRTWSRLRVDTKFRDDIRTLCRRWLNTPAERPYLDTCLNGITAGQLIALGLNAPAEALARAGAETYYQLVRENGLVGYDTDATTPGTQNVIPEATRPTGGARDNA